MVHFFALDRILVLHISVFIFITELYEYTFLCKTSRENKLHELCQDLVSRLKGRCQFVEAAEILSEHLGDVEESIAVLVQGRLWSKAIWYSFHYKRPDMIGKYIIGSFMICTIYLMLKM
jgi:hypothetical protein